MSDFKFVIITPCFNASKNLDNIANSLLEQTHEDWIWIISDDESTDDTGEEAIRLVNKVNGRACYFPSNGDKKFALKNIVTRIEDAGDIIDDQYNGPKITDDKVIIGVIDGDDQLCNPKALELVVNEYERGSDIVWTAHKWDVNPEMNVSGLLPDKISPYHYHWCASHFRTFRKDLFNKVNKENFKDAYGEWFKRGYDQALMLPMLYLSENRKYLDEVCYQYNIISVSMDRKFDTTSEQLNVVKFVRARGFIE